MRVHFLVVSQNIFFKLVFYSATRNNLVKKKKKESSGHYCNVTWGRDCSLWKFTHPDFIFNCLLPEWKGKNKDPWKNNLWVPSSKSFMWATFEETGFSNPKKKKSIKEYLWLDLLPIYLTFSRNLVTMTSIWNFS